MVGAKLAVVYLLGFCSGQDLVDDAWFSDTRSDFCHNIASSTCRYT